MTKKDADLAASATGDPAHSASRPRPVLERSRNLIGPFRAFLFANGLAASFLLIAVARPRRLPPPLYLAYYCLTAVLAFLWLLSTRTLVRRRGLSASGLRACRFEVFIAAASMALLLFPIVRNAQGSLVFGLSTAASASFTYVIFAWLLAAWASSCRTPHREPESGSVDTAPADARNVSCDGARRRDRRRGIASGQYAWALER